MRCGVGDYTARLVSALAAHSEVHVGVLTGVGASAWNGSNRIELFPVVRDWSLADVRRIVAALRSWRPDVVHVQYPTQGYEGRRLPWFVPAIFRLLGWHVIQTWHEHMPMRSWRCSVPLILTAQGIIVVRPDYRQRLARWVKWLIGSTPFEVIPNASVIPTVSLTENQRTTIRTKYLGTSSEIAGMVVFFGFAYAHKRLELLFEMADPDRHRLVFVCELKADDPYHAQVLKRLQSKPWLGNASVTGFLPQEDVARILAAADAVVLPFQRGGGTWNSSVHAATAQGTFVLTTSHEQHGYESADNIYFAAPNDVDDMRHALNEYLGRRRSVPVSADGREWGEIAEAHLRLYQASLGKKRCRV